MCSVQRVQAVYETTTALVSAISEGHIKTATALIRLGANVSKAAVRGATRRLSHPGSPCLWVDTVCAGMVDPTQRDHNNK